MLFVAVIITVFSGCVVDSTGPSGDSLISNGIAFSSSSSEVGLEETDIPAYRFVGNPRWGNDVDHAKAYLYNPHTSSFSSVVANITESGDSYWIGFSGYFEHPDFSAIRCCIKAYNESNQLIGWKWTPLLTEGDFLWDLSLQQYVYNFSPVLSQMWAPL